MLSSKMTGGMGELIGGSGSGRSSITSENIALTSILEHVFDRGRFEEAIALQA